MRQATRKQTKRVRVIAKLQDGSGSHHSQTPSCSGRQPTMSMRGRGHKRSQGPSGRGDTREEQDENRNR